MRAVVGLADIEQGRDSRMLELRGAAGLAQQPIDVFGTGEVAGSMSLVFALADFKNYDIDLLGSRLRGAAAQLSHKLAELRRSLSTSPSNTAASAKAKPPSRGGVRPSSIGKRKPPTLAPKSPASAKRRARA